MLDINFYNLDEINDSLLKFSVIACKYKGKWVFCKHKERATWEIPGGKREPSEGIFETAKRELFEETGAVRFEINPVYVCSVKRDVESFGLLGYAEIYEFDSFAAERISEMERVEFFDSMPDNLTYPHIQPYLFARIISFFQDQKTTN